MPIAVTAFFEPKTFSVSYVAADLSARRCVVIDPVLDYEARSGRTGTRFAQGIVDFVRRSELSVDWVLETHIHADHLTATPFICRELGGRTGIGNKVPVVQRTFGALFNAGPAFATDGSQFDHLFGDGEQFAVGTITASVMHTPGHTPACSSYLIGDALFVGDTMFMPDYGTARCDFPGGDARALYASIRRLLALPAATRIFVGHDYGPAGRPFTWETTVGAQRNENKHVRDGIDEASFVAQRQARDKELSLPDLILPAVQVNMRAGRLPPAESNGRVYLKIPLDSL